MKSPAVFRALVLLAIGCFAQTARAAAPFRVLIDASTTNAAINTPVTFTIKVRNESLIDLPQVQALSVFPSTAAIGIYTNNLVNTLPSNNQIVTNAGRVTFNIDRLGLGQEAILTLQLTPTRVGTFNHTVTAQAQSQTAVTTNLAVNVIAGNVDLGVQIAQLPAAVLVNDLVTYKVSVTNAGPADATPSVTLQTRLLDKGAFISATPAVATTFSDDVLLLAVGPLTNTASKDFLITLQPTNAGPFRLSTTIMAPSSQNTETAANNNTITNSVDVLGLVTTNLGIVFSSTATFNRQTGLLDQTVAITNLSAAAIPSIRIIATNLTAPNRLFNATGANNGLPYINTTAPLAAGEKVTMHLQFYFTNRTTAPVGLLVVEAPAPVLTLPTGASIAITKTIRLNNETMFLEFPTTPGRTYAVIYAPDTMFTNSLAAQPLIQALNSRTQFIDDGPPKTAAVPTNTLSRFYRVVEIP